MSEPDEPVDRARAVSAATVQEGPRARSRPEATPATPALSVFDPPPRRFAEAAELGRGGMGRVVAAVDRALDRPVAIKHLLATAPQDVARFEREVRITARLQHAAIVPVLDAGRGADGQPFYVMRKIDGEPLADLVERAPGVRDRLALVPAVLCAIDAAAYAHARGILHRDIKPWNILVGPFGEALLIDWGLAREVDDPDDPAASIPMAAARDPADPRDDRDSLTRVGVAYGTPGFMAPEQARGEPVDRRADVYSLGATLFFVLAGALPFDAETPTAAIERAAADHRPDLARLPREIPAELGDIVGKALASDRAARYVDAGELAKDLRRFLAGQLVAAHAYTPRERVARWLRRHRLVTAIAAVALVAVAATALVSVRRVVAERDTAELARTLAEERAEDNLLARAGLLVTVDPTSAVALLRALPPTSPRWAEAREIVRVASASGIERSLGGQTSRTTLVVSADDQLASVTSDYAIELRALPAGAPRRVATVPHGTNGLTWLGRDTLVAYNSTDHTAVLVDVASGQLRTIPEPDIETILADADHVYTLTSDRVLARFDRQLVRTQLGEHVHAADVGGGGVAFVTTSSFVVIDPDGTRHERTVPLRRTFQISLAPRGDRVAIATGDEVWEWTVDGDAPPHHWPIDVEAASETRYIDDVLWMTSNNGAGAVTLDPQGSTTRWRVRGQFLAMQAFAGGVLLATHDGRLAYSDRYGTVPIPHRQTHVLAATTNRAGTQVILSTWDGELLSIDLRPVRPVTWPTGGAHYGKLLALGGDRLVAADPMTDMVMESSHVWAIEPSGARHLLEGIGPNAVVDVMPTGIAACDDTSRACRVWDRDGHQRLAVDAIIATIGDGLAGGRSLFYASPAGAVIEQPIDGDRPARTLDTFPLIPAPRGAQAPVWGLRSGERTIAVTSRAVGGHSHFAVYSASGKRALAFPEQSLVSLGGATADGSWWAVENATRLLHLVGDEVHPVPLDTDIVGTSVRGDHVWVFGHEVLYVLASDGTPLRRVRFSGVSERLAAGADDLAFGTLDGIELIAPEVDVRRTLHLPSGVESLCASPDGRTLVATTHGGADVVQWTDPVPLDAAAIPAFLDTLTNAHLVVGSDALVWR